MRFTQRKYKNIDVCVCFRVSQLFNTATLSYILPTHRATVYIMGIILGYYLHYHSSVPLKLSKVSAKETHYSIV